jgi:hypothetical protein
MDTKVGDMLTCVEDTGSPFIFTKGKTYEVLENGIQDNVGFCRGTISTFVHAVPPKTFGTVADLKLNEGDVVGFKGSGVTWVVVGPNRLQGKRGGYLDKSYFYSGSIQCADFYVISRAEPVVNYNDGKWHEWTGGDCPVHPDTLVDFTLEAGRTHTFGNAGCLRWDHRGSSGDIVAFRVAKEYVGTPTVEISQVEPRELWFVKDDCVGHYRMISHEPLNGWDEVIHVKEVLT